MESGGKRIGDEASQEAAAAIDSFPFMMQLVGYRAWNAAGTDDVIGPEATQRGTRNAAFALLKRSSSTVCSMPSWPSY